jgi:hypothetical protein
MMKNNLPLYAFAQSELTGKTMMIILGERGLHHWDKNNVKSSDELNFLHGVTSEEAKAMWVGAMFGWDMPGADPDYHKPGTIQRSVSRRGRMVG